MQVGSDEILSHSEEVPFSTSEFSRAFAEIEAILEPEGHAHDTLSRYFREVTREDLAIFIFNCHPQLLGPLEQHLGLKWDAKESQWKKSDYKKKDIRSSKLTHTKLVERSSTLVLKNDSRQSI